MEAEEESAMLDEMEKQDSAALGQFVGAVTAGQDKAIETEEEATMRITDTITSADPVNKASEVDTNSTGSLKKKTSTYSFINENTEELESQGILLDINKDGDEVAEPTLCRSSDDEDNTMDVSQHLEEDLRESGMYESLNIDDDSTDYSSRKAIDYRAAGLQERMVVCLEQPPIIDGRIQHPTSEKIRRLLRRGLVGRVELNGKMTDAEIREEVHCCFANAFDYRPFAYNYLMVDVDENGVENKDWFVEVKEKEYNGAEVLTLCGHRIFIIVKRIGSVASLPGLQAEESESTNIERSDLDTGINGKSQSTTDTRPGSLLQVKEEPQDEQEEPVDTRSEDTLSFVDKEDTEYSPDGLTEDDSSEDPTVNIMESVKLDESGNIQHVQYVDKKIMKQQKRQQDLEDEMEDMLFKDASSTSSYCASPVGDKEDMLTEDTLKAAREKVEQDIATRQDFGSGRKGGRTARASAVKARTSIAVMNELALVSADKSTEEKIDRRRKYEVEDEDPDVFDPPRKRSRGRPRIRPIVTERRPRGRPRTKTIREYVGEPEGIERRGRKPTSEVLSYPNLTQESPFVRRIRRRIVLRGPPSEDIGDKRHASRIKCKFCGDYQKTLLHLYQHLAVRHPYNLSRFECQECGSLFKTAAAMEEHLAVHTMRYAEVIYQIPRLGEEGRYQYSCPVYLCEKKAMTWTKIVNHLYHHKSKDCLLCGDRIYPCPMKTFCTHVSMHIEGGPYVCPKCPKTFFSQIGHFKDHLRLMHGAENKSWICRFCFKYFETFAEFDLHLLGWHSNKPYCCQYCGQEFSSMLTLEWHLENHDRGEAHDKLFQACYDSFRSQSGNKRKPCYSQGSTSEIETKKTSDPPDKRLIQVIRKDGSVRMMRSLDEVNNFAKPPASTSAFSPSSKSPMPRILKRNPPATPSTPNAPVSILPNIIKMPAPVSLPQGSRHQVYIVRPATRVVPGGQQQYMTLVPLGTATKTMQAPVSLVNSLAPTTTVTASTSNTLQPDKSKGTGLQITNVRQGGLVEESGDHSDGEATPIVIAPIQEKSGDDNKLQKHAASGDLKVCHHAHCLTVSTSAIDLWINHYFPTHFNREDDFEFMCRSCASLYANYDWPPMSHSCKKAQYIYICTDCGLLFQTMREKMQHFPQCKYYTTEASIMHAGPVDLLTCQYCLVTVPTITELCVHLLKKHASVRFGSHIVCCEQCTVIRRFLDVEHLWEHNRVSHSEWWKLCGRWLCPLCGIDHTTEQEFKEHALYSHASYSSPRHFCNMCLQVFSNSVEYNTHDSTCTFERKKKEQSASLFGSPTNKVATVIAPLDDYDVGQRLGSDPKADPPFRETVNPLVIAPEGEDGAQQDDADHDDSHQDDDVDDESDQEVLIQVIEPKGNNQTELDSKNPEERAPEESDSSKVRPTSEENPPNESSLDERETLSTQTDEPSLSLAITDVRTCDTEPFEKVPKVEPIVENVVDKQTVESEEPAESTTIPEAQKCQRCEQWFGDFEALRDHARLSHKPESKLLMCPCTTQPPALTMKWPHKYWQHIISTHPEWMLQHEKACTVCGELFKENKQFEHHLIYQHNHDVKSITIKDCIEMVSKIHRAKKYNLPAKTIEQPRVQVEPDVKVQPDTTPEPINITPEEPLTQSDQPVTKSDQPFTRSEQPITRPETSLVIKELLEAKPGQVEAKLEHLVAKLEQPEAKLEQSEAKPETVKSEENSGGAKDGPIMISSSDDETEPLSTQNIGIAESGSPMNTSVTDQAPQTVHVCTQCGKNLPDLPSLRRHERIEHPAGLIKCEKCKQRIEVDKMASHVCGNEECEVAPVFPCEFCSEKFSYLAAKNRHIASNHRNQLKRCMTCGKAFVTQETLDKHIQKMHPALYKKAKAPLKSTTTTKVIDMNAIMASAPTKSQTTSVLIRKQVSANLATEPMQKEPEKKAIKNAVFSKNKANSNWVMKNATHMMYSKKCRYCKKLLVNWSENAQHEATCAKNPVIIAKKAKEHQERLEKKHYGNPAASLRDLLSGQMFDDSDSGDNESGDDAATQTHWTGLGSDTERHGSGKGNHNNDDDDTSSKGSGGRIIALRHNVSSSEDECDDVIYVSTDAPNAKDTILPVTEKRQRSPDVEKQVDDVFGSDAEAKRRALEEEVFGPSKSSSVVNQDVFGSEAKRQRKELEEEVFGPKSSYKELVEEVFGPEKTANTSLVDQVFGPPKPTGSSFPDKVFEVSPEATSSGERIFIPQSIAKTIEPCKTAEDGVFGRLRTTNAALVDEAITSRQSHTTFMDTDSVTQSSSRNQITYPVVEICPTEEVTPKKQMATTVIEISPMPGSAVSERSQTQRSGQSVTQVLENPFTCLSSTEPDNGWDSQEEEEEEEEEEEAPAETYACNFCDKSFSLECDLEIHRLNSQHF